MVFEEKQMKAKHLMRSNSILSFCSIVLFFPGAFSFSIIVLLLLFQRGRLHLTQHSSNARPLRHLNLGVLT